MTMSTFHIAIALMVLLMPAASGYGQAPGLSATIDSTRGSPPATPRDPSAVTRTYDRFTDTSTLTASALFYTYALEHIATDSVSLAFRVSFRGASAPKRFPPATLAFSAGHLSKARAASPHFDAAEEINILINGTTRLASKRAVYSPLLLAGVGIIENGSFPLAAGDIEKIARAKTIEVRLGIYELKQPEKLAAAARRLLAERR